MSAKVVRLPPNVNRILYVKNLPFKMTSEELYEIFGKYGAVRQIRLGNTAETKGSCYVVYEDIFEAKNAYENLSGYNVGDNRYLVVVYYRPEKMMERMEAQQQEKEILEARRKTKKEEK